VSPTPANDRTLDDLIHSNTRILRTKVEMIAAAAQERLKIRRDNIARIADDREKLAEMMHKISIAANYHLRDHKEKDRLYQRAFDLAREHRDQDTECWRDIVLVLRDFLNFWDEYERAKARGEFLQNV
jgi:DNA-binding protein H-NS